MCRLPISNTVSPDQSPHYIRAVTGMSAAHEIVVDQDIYSSNGTKLLAKGAQLNQHHFELLTQHRLKIPLDNSLSLAGPVSPAQLALEAAQMIEHDALLAQIAASSGDALAVKHALAQLPLSAALCFRLSVMRSQRAALYQHSLRSALLAHALALRLELAEHERCNLLLAALCHDIGELHTDPVLLAPGRELSRQERRYLYVHPVTGFVLLQQLLPASCRSAALAVLHHHERADGSGYPYGLNFAQIHPLGRILALVEVSEGLLRRQDLDRLDVLLKLGKPRFASAAIGALRDLLRAAPDRLRTRLRPRGEIEAGLARLSDVLLLWKTLGAQLGNAPGEALPLGFLFERMETLRSLVLQTGCDPDDMATVLEQVEEDEEALHELASLAGEFCWLMNDLANEIERRTPARDPQTRELLQALIRALNSA
ncbi:HD-GYP domain-containing protein [Niveibacterium terrae]|uniref:HD-GYP domain-containing protein n=1 Tax=Niveibacterium terrae TaxID=3373598 RepID=UPI003A8EE630